MGKNIYLTDIKARKGFAWATYIYIYIFYHLGSHIIWHINMAHIVSRSVDPSKKRRQNVIIFGGSVRELVFIAIRMSINTFGLSSKLYSLLRDLIRLPNS